MKLQVLGCWAPYPRAGDACPGYLLTEAEISLLLDCGHGVMSQLGKFMDFRALKCLVLTHYHPDHTADVSALRHAVAGSLRDGSRTEKIAVFAPRSPENEAALLHKCSDAFNICWIEDLAASAGVFCGRIADLQLSFRKVPHSLPAYAVKIVNGRQQSMTYTGDMSYEPDFSSFVRGSSLLLAEASLKNKDAALTFLGHLTAGQAGRIAAEAGVKTLLLTHFWPEYDPEELQREAGNEFTGIIKLASSGSSYIIE